MAVGGIVFLIYFIHHIATSIQASNIIASVTAETLATVDRLYPVNLPDTSDVTVTAANDLSSGWRTVTADREGYIDHIDFPRLAELAGEMSAVVRIERGIGDFIIEGAPLLAVSADGAGTVEVEAQLRRTIDISRQLTLEQNVGYGIRQLVDIALRALSPGINDTTTAVMCVEYLSAILSRVATRQISGGDNPETASPLVINPRAPEFARFADDSFNQIRDGARGNVAVIESLFVAIGTIGTLSIVPSRRQVLADHIARLEETIRSVESAHERERLVALATRIRAQVMVH
jgi:uncharacterized membrane protein